MNIGDKIKDIEDEDCYFEGVVTQTEPLKYLVTKIFWSGKEDLNDKLIGTEIQPKWWIQEKI